MDNIRDSKIHAVLDVLFRVTGENESVREELTKKAQTMDDKELIDELSKYVNEKAKSDPELYEYLLTYIRNINPVVAPSVEEM